MRMKIVREHINEARGFMPLKYEPPYEGSIRILNNTTLLPKNLPKKITGSFDCSHSRITSLDGASSTGQDFNCSHTDITSLKDAPLFVGDSFYCHNTKVPKEEVERYWRSGAVKGIIFSDYGEYRN